MKETIHIKSVSQFHQLVGQSKPRHPLVSVERGFDYSSHTTQFNGIRFVSDLFLIVLKEGVCGKVMYGHNAYDFEEGTLLFFAPGQAMEFESNVEMDGHVREAWRLIFHPDLIRKSDLANHIDEYSFFNYDLNEGLHLSQDEKDTIEEILVKIVNEYNQHIDRHSHRLINSNIHLLLDYCLRFYDRQFYTRTNLNSDVVSKFERLLKDYFKTGKAVELGVPSVSYCANELSLSTNYFSDLLKKETGKSAQEHIHTFIIDKAKTMLLGSTDSISQIGYALGFEYPNYFSNLFKSHTGVSPRVFRNLN
ncbi:MAG: helix-turn-helix domain-containing protein [Cytophagales bacterium]|nr:helix-turn-helix domain-containing protein [Cytophagales bacterium]